MPPAVTISLVTHNGARWLPACLASLSAQECRDYELLVLDNASSDGSVEQLEALASEDARVSLSVSNENLGYAVAHNRHIFRAQSEFVVLLNQDIVLDRSFLSRGLSAFNGNPQAAAVQGRVRRLDGNGARTMLIDTTGLVMHRDRRVIARRQGELEADEDLRSGPVWGVDGPAPIYRRAALLDATLPRTGGGIEVLDEDFFMYKEDVDLAWRLRQLGWTAWYEPSALAWHARGAGKGRPTSLVDVAMSRWAIPRWIRRTSWRNQHLMQIKNETSGGLARDFLPIARREIMSLGFMTAFDPARLPAVLDLVRCAPAALAKRRSIARRGEHRHETGAPYDR